VEQQEQPQQSEFHTSEEKPKEEEEEQQREGEDSMGPAAKKQRVDGGGGGQPQQQQQQKKNKKAPTPEQAVRTEIHQAAKANDLAAALAAFDRAKAGGIRLSPDLYVSLLYLCGGGDSWVQQLRQQEAAHAAPGAGEAALPGADDSGPEAVEVAAPTPEGQQPDAAPAAAPLPQPCAEEVLRRAQGLFDEMQASQGRLQLNEMCYTAMARLAAGGGDADKAFQLAQASWAGLGGQLTVGRSAAGSG
jgi:proteinaceous RNase P